MPEVTTKEYLNSLLAAYQNAEKIYSQAVSDLVAAEIRRDEAKHAKDEAFARLEEAREKFGDHHHDASSIVSGGGGGGVGGGTNNSVDGRSNNSYNNSNRYVPRSNSFGKKNKVGGFRQNSFGKKGFKKQSSFQKRGGPPYNNNNNNPRRDFDPDTSSRSVSSNNSGGNQGRQYQPQQQQQHHHLPQSPMRGSSKIKDMIKQEEQNAASSSLRNVQTDATTNNNNSDNPIGHEASSRSVTTNQHPNMPDIVVSKPSGRAPRIFSNNNNNNNSPYPNSTRPNNNNNNEGYKPKRNPSRIVTAAMLTKLGSPKNVLEIAKARSKDWFESNLETDSVGLVKSFYKGTFGTKTNAKTKKLSVHSIILDDEWNELVSQTNQVQEMYIGKSSDPDAPLTLRDKAAEALILPPQREPIALFFAPKNTKGTRDLYYGGHWKVLDGNFLKPPRAVRGQLRQCLAKFEFLGIDQALVEAINKD